MNDNIRIVWDNVADRGDLIASNEAGNLVVDNLLSDIKSQVWRGLSTRATVACGWDRAEPVGAVILAFTNFTSQATMRVKGYETPDTVAPEYDSGAVLCAAPPALGQFQWGAPLGENFYRRGGSSLFAYGYGGYAVHWVPGGRAFCRVEVEINDPTNPDTYLEAGRLIVGPWWSPTYNFDFNHALTPVDSSPRRRTEGGDLRGERGAKWRKIEFTLSYMDPSDRAAMLRLMRRFGVNDAFFISLFPNNDDKILEQSYQLWGKMVDPGRLSQPRYASYMTAVEVEEM